MNVKYSIAVIFLATFLLGLGACKKSETSRATGWELNNPEWGGYEKVDYKGQETGPNLVLIPGGTFLMGQTEEDVMFRWNNVPRRVTVSSFYMDQTEVTNYDYRFYTEYTKDIFGVNNRQIYLNTLPDTLVWLEELAYNEPLVYEYFRHPAYDDYPVVGVTWEQARDFCVWRTDRTNEAILIKKGILNPSATEQQDADHFTTDAYLVGQYEGNVRKNLEDMSTGEGRGVKKSDGIMLPDYRLPTEAEWEYAALALVGNMQSEENELITDRKLYPWNGNSMRYQRHDKNQGDMMANFKRGKGDYMGIAGNLNDNAPVPSAVGTYYPNDFGLYNMGGNVSEWVADVYRPLTSETFTDSDEQDLNPFRGNEFEILELDEEGRPVEKDSTGHLKKRSFTEEELKDRRNFTESDVRNYEDGDSEYVVYETGVTTLISDKSRVYKGASWSDRAYYVTPGARRFLEQDLASKNIGFRCAMTRTGGSSGNDDKVGNSFKYREKQVKRRFK